jgi:hypothetical protein
MPISRRLALFLFVNLLATGLFRGQADAIPAFSREHNTECSTCHTIYPELNEYGDVFLKNGFVWAKHKKDEGSGKGAAKVVIKGEGDPATLERLKEQAALPDQGSPEPAMGAPRKSEPLWLAGLPQTLPLSVAASMDAAYSDDRAYDKVDLSTRSLSLLSGGVFRDRLGFFAKYNLYAQGELNPAVSNTPTSLDSPYARDLEELYLVWRKAFGSPFSIKTGRFRPQLSLWKRTNKAGVSDFATTSYRVGDSRFSADAPEDGVEVNAVLFNRLFLATGIVDRNGQDRNEGYGHISLKIGGSDFNAREPDIDLDQESIFDYMYLVLGGYGYTGRNSGSLVSNERNNFFRGGAELDFVFKNFRLKGAWARGKDANPDFGSHVEHETDVYVSEADLLITPDLMVLFRYELQETDPGFEITRYIPAIAFAPIQNTKITLEYQHADARGVQSNMTLLGIRLAF